MSLDKKGKLRASKCRGQDGEKCLAIGPLPDAFTLSFGDSV